MKLGYNELGYNEHSVITNKKYNWLVQVIFMINLPGYNEQKKAQKDQKFAFLAQYF